MTLAYLTKKDNTGVNTVVNTGVYTRVVTVVNTGLNAFYQVTHCELSDRQLMQIIAFSRAVPTIEATEAIASVNFCSLRVVS